MTSRFDCNTCGASFNRSFNLKRHKTLIHESLLEHFKCDWPKCFKTYTRADSLARHKSGHTSSFVCDLCNTAFKYKSDLVRHLATLHSSFGGQSHSKIVRDRFFECSECGLKVFRKDSLIWHIRHKHQTNESYFKCDVCGALFRFRKNLRRHQKTKHDGNSRRSYARTKICALCHESFVGKAAVVDHYRNYHNVQLQKQELDLPSEMEFSAWKKDIEKLTDSRYVKVLYNRRKNGSVSVVYACHRSGMARKRYLRTLDSKKLNAVCPAEMEVQMSSSGCKVTFLQTHLGHLSTSYAEPCQRAQIASNITTDVPLHQMCDDNQHDDPPYTYDLKQKPKLIVPERNEEFVQSSEEDSYEIEEEIVTIFELSDISGPSSACSTTNSSPVCDERKTPTITCQTENIETTEYTSYKEKMLNRFKEILNNSPSIDHLNMVDRLLDSALPAVSSFTLRPRKKTSNAI